MLKLKHVHHHIFLILQRKRERPYAVLNSNFLARLGATLGVAVAFSGFFIYYPALAETGYRVLDEAAIAVKTPNHVFLISVTRAGSRLVAAGEHGVIIYSDDNGLTWRQAAVPVSATLTSLVFPTPLCGWAVGHYGVILHTKDGGLTWQLQLTGIVANQLTLQAANQAVASNDSAIGTPLAITRAQHFINNGPDKPFLTIWSKNENEAIAFGAYRIAMKTTNGGKTWADWSLHIGDKYSQNLYRVVSVGSDLYLTAETGLVFHSNDAGDTFPELAQPASGTLLGGVDTGNGGVLVFGVAGQSLQSNDSGRTWTNVTINNGANLTSAVTLTDRSIVIGSEDGTLFISRNHASSFTALRDSVPMAVSDLTQAANGDLVLVGSAGVLSIPAQDLDQN